MTKNKFKKSAKLLNNIPALIPAVDAMVLIQYEVGAIKTLPQNIIKKYNKE